MDYPSSHLSLLGVHERLGISILCHAIENILANKINAAHSGKDKSNTVRCIMAFQYSDWLYVLQHGIKTLNFTGKSSNNKRVF